MTTGTMSALEGDGSSLGGIVQANWYYFFHQKGEGVDVFGSPIYFALPASGSFSTAEGVDTFSSAGDITAQGSLVVTEGASDAFSADGSAAIYGELSATESSDDFNSTGKLLVDGSMQSSETGSDAFSAESPRPTPTIQSGGGRPMDLDWKPWPLLTDEVIRRAKRKRSDILLLLH